MAEALPKAGGAEFLQEAVRLHSQAVYNLALRTARNPQDAEDIVQETFAVLAREAGKIREPGALKTWLLRTAIRIAWKASSRARRRRLAEREAASGEEGIGMEAHSDLSEWITRALDRLPESLRLPLVLHYLQGLSHAEVAAVVGCPPGSVSTRMREGLEKLRKAVPAALGVLAMAELEEALGAVPVQPVPPVLMRALEAGAASSAAGTSMATWGGAAMTIKKAVLVTAAILLLIVGIWTALAPGRPPVTPVRFTVPSLSPRTAEVPRSSLPTPPVPEKPVAPTPTTENAAVIGQVTCQETGKPVVGITVGLYSRLPVDDDWEIGEGEMTFRVQAKTDTQGRFRLEVPLGDKGASRYVLVAGMNGVRGNGELAPETGQGVIPYESWREPFRALRTRYRGTSLGAIPQTDRESVSFPALVPGEERRHDLVLSRGVGFRLEVRDAGSGTLTHELLKVRYRIPVPEGVDPALGYGGGLCQIEDGTFQIDGMDPTRVDLDRLAFTPIKDGWRRTYSGADAATTVEGIRIIEVTLPFPGPGLSGTVQGMDGLPWEKPCEVLGYPSRRTREEADKEALTFRLPVMKDGSFEIHFLPPGETEFLLQAKAQGLALPSPLVKVALGGRADLRLTPGWELTGQVLDAAGKPAPKARVIAWFPDRVAEGNGDLEHDSTETDKEGRFKFVALGRREGLSVAVFPPNEEDCISLDWTDPQAPVLESPVVGSSFRATPSGWRRVPPGLPTLDIRLSEGLQSFP